MFKDLKAIYVSEKVVRVFRNGTSYDLSPEQLPGVINMKLSLDELDKEARKPKLIRKAGSDTDFDPDER